MATQILNLPLLSFDMVVTTNEDWLDSWAYVDASGNPVSLAGLVLNFALKPSPVGVTASVLASTATSNGGLPVNGSVIVGGAGGNVAGLNIPRALMQRIASTAYVFELQAQGDGVTRTIATGTATVNRGLNP